MSTRLLLILALTLGLFNACEDDQGDQAGDLLGRWEVIHAFRDQAPTESLTGLYYEFAADGKLRTNMTGAEESYVYAFNDGQLAQREGPLDADYKVEELTLDTLILKTELRRKQFRIILQKTTFPNDSIPSVE